MFSKKFVFESWENDILIENLCEGLPDEFHKDCVQWYSEFDKEFSRIKGSILLRQIEMLKQVEDRKGFAALAVKEPYSKVHFTLYDAKPHDHLINKIIGENLC